MRRLVTNAIRWTAGDSIPSGRLELDGQEVGVDDLLENQDYDPPKKFDPEKTAEEFKLQSSDDSAANVR